MPALTICAVGTLHRPELRRFYRFAALASTPDMVGTRADSSVRGPQIPSPSASSNGHRHDTGFATISCLILTQRSSFFWFKSENDGFCRFESSFLGLSTWLRSCIATVPDELWVDGLCGVYRVAAAYLIHQVSDGNGPRPPGIRATASGIGAKFINEAGLQATLQCLSTGNTDPRKCWMHLPWFRWSHVVPSRDK